MQVRVINACPPLKEMVELLPKGLQRPKIFPGVQDASIRQGSWYVYLCVSHCGIVVCTGHKIRGSKFLGISHPLFLVLSMVSRCSTVALLPKITIVADLLGPTLFVFT